MEKNKQQEIEEQLPLNDFLKFDLGIWLDLIKMRKLKANSVLYEQKKYRTRVIEFI